MKKKFLLLLLMITTVVGSLQAQFRKAPSVVKDSLKVKFPNAQKVEWKDKVSYFEADFVSEGVEMSAEFSSKGEWQETDKKLSFDQLPAAVKDGFKESKYNDWTPGSVTQIDKKDKSTMYKVFVEKSSLVQKKFLYFSREGQLEKEEQSL